MVEGVKVNERLLSFETSDGRGRLAVLAAKVAATLCRHLGMTFGEDPVTPIPQHRPGLDYDHPIARLDRVTLMSHAIWTLAAERLQLSDDQLKERMMKLDLEDGVRDRKVSVAPKRCACGAMVGAKPGWCISCGEHSDFSPFAGI